jgi:hypothetical protein
MRSRRDFLQRCLVIVPVLGNCALSMRKPIKQTEVICISTPAKFYPRIHSWLPTLYKALSSDEEGREVIKRFFLSLFEIPKQLTVADVSLGFRHIPCSCNKVDSISTWGSVIFSARITGEFCILQDTINRLQKEYKTKQD